MNRAPSPRTTALGANASAVGLDQALADRKPEPATDPVVAGGVFLEQPRELVGRDPATLVDDGNG